jgi:hypothetical protein
MTRIRFSVVLLWLASLVLTGILASAQTRREAGAVISGGDIGFRPDGWNGKARTGTWVVRINGEWVDAQASMKAVPATTR